MLVLWTCVIICIYINQEVVEELKAELKLAKDANDLLKVSVCTM